MVIAAVDELEATGEAHAILKEMEKELQSITQKVARLGALFPGNHHLDTSSTLQKFVSQTQSWKQTVNNMESVMDVRAREGGIIPAQRVRICIRAPSLDWLIDWLICCFN